MWKYPQCRNGGDCVHRLEEHLINLERDTAATNRETDPIVERSSRETLQWAIVLLCFFLSGAAGLIYEVCWIRIASLGFGSTTFALSSVLGIFFLGLAMGSHFAGKFAQRSAKPLLYYAGLEIVLAILVFLTPVLFGWVEGLFGAVYRSTDSSSLHAMVRILLIAVVILPPTIIMGATFPLFCRFLIRTNRRIAAGVAVVYSVNTLGAAAGCAIAGFWLLPAIGTQLSLVTGCCISLACGLIVLLLPLSRRDVSISLDVADAKGDRSDSDEIEAEESAASQIETESLKSDGRRRATGARIIPFLFFLVGFSALGMEIIWTRYLSLLVHNSVYTYTITLSVTLLGIVVGSLLVSCFLDGRAPRARYFGAIQTVLAISIVALMMTPPQTWMQIDQKVWLYGILLFFPAVLSGASYPLAIRMAVDDVRNVARTSGTMAACNTLGGILGSLAVGFFALPQLGLQNSLLMITGVNLVIGVTAWLVLDRMNIVIRSVAAIVAVAIWIAIPILTGVKLPQDYLARYGKVADFVEGYGSNISVIESGNQKVLRIDGHWQGTNQKNHQIMAAHFPMQLLNDPKSVAVVGIGPGQTASRFLMYDIEHLYCVDIEPRLFDVVEEHFAGDWMKDPRTHIVREDGRNFLKHTDQKFDLISIELGQVFRPGVATFYTQDFYEEISLRLTDDGLVSQFVPISYFTPETFRSVLHTFVTVFPESTLWYNKSEFLLIGRKQGKIELDRNRFLADQVPTKVREDLEFSHWGGPRYRLNQFDDFASCFLMGPEELAQLSQVKGVTAFRDDLPELDYAVSMMKLRGDDAYDIDNGSMVRRQLSPIDTILSDATINAADARQHLQVMRIQRMLNIADIGITFLLARAPKSDSIEDIDERIELGMQMVAESPGHVRAHDVLAGALLKKGNIAAAEPHLRVVVEADNSNLDAVKGLAESLLLLGRAAEAIPLYEHAVKLAPDQAGLRNKFGVALAEVKRFSDAKEQFTIAFELDPQLPDVKNNLEAVERELNNSSQ